MTESGKPRNSQSTTLDHISALGGFASSSVAYFQGSKTVISEMRAIERCPGRAVISGLNYWRGGFPLVGTHYVNLYKDTRLIDNPIAVLTCDGPGEATMLDWLREPGDWFISANSAERSWQPVSRFRQLLNYDGGVVLSNLGTRVDSLAVDRGEVSSLKGIQFDGLATDVRTAPLMESWSTSEKAVFDLRPFGSRTLLPEWRLISPRTLSGVTALDSPHDLVIIAPVDGATWSPDMGLRFSIRGPLPECDLLLIQCCVPMQGAPDWYCEYEVDRDSLLFDANSQTVTADILASLPTRANPESFSAQAIPGLFEAYLRPVGCRGLYVLWKVAIVRRGHGITAASPWSGMIFDTLSSMK